MHEKKGRIRKEPMKVMIAFFFILRPLLLKHV